LRVKQDTKFDNATAMKTKSVSKHSNTKALEDNKHLNDKEQLICLYDNNHNKKNNTICNDIKIVKMLQAVHSKWKREKKRNTKKSALVKVINSNKIIPWGKFILKMFTGAQLVKKYSVFCKTPRFLSRRRNSPLWNLIVSQLSRL
jgi:hypothetical protein